jgi:hypothetical protein
MDIKPDTKVGPKQLIDSGDIRIGNGMAAADMNRHDEGLRRERALG